MAAPGDASDAARFRSSLPLASVAAAALTGIWTYLVLLQTPPPTWFFYAGAHGLDALGWLFLAFIWSGLLWASMRRPHRRWAVMASASIALTLILAVLIVNAWAGFVGIP
ncbi:hypothetical protein [Anaeromyxobacter oryzae]|uniref:hypothetical protein n=1 Tax=Anaeromyxobacter oryzae TaxID=2918170 RepID=UPI0020BE7D29|nr:hypothetical protein [Anaeromyxobacter oryzae]